jgi:hypothetical protein
VLDVLGAGRVLGRLATPPGVEALIHDARQRQLYATSPATGRVTVYRQPDPFRYEVLETAGTRPLAGLGAADGRTGRLFLAAGEFVAIAPKPDGSGGGTRILPNTYTVLVMKRLPLE